jgi:hypothetical protein
MVQGHLETGKSAIPTERELYPDGDWLTLISQCGLFCPDLSAGEVEVERKLITVITENLTP